MCACGLGDNDLAVNLPHSLLHVCIPSLNLTWTAVCACGLGDNGLAVYVCMWVG